MTVVDCVLLYFSNVDWNEIVMKFYCDKIVIKKIYFSLKLMVKLYYTLIVIYVEVFLKVFISVQ